MSVTTLARSLAHDGRFSLQDATRVIDEAARAGGADEVRRLLADPDFFALADPGARRRLDEFLQTQAPSTGALGALPDGTKVFLKEGVFVAAPDARLPSSAQEYGQLLYRAARLFAEPGLSLTDGLSLGDKQAVVERVLVGLTQARAGAGVPPGYDDEEQAAQQRSASATVLREIVSSLKGASGQGRLLQDQALRALVDLVRQETMPGLRDHMAFHLHAIQDDLATPEQQKLVDEVYCAFAPEAPPYDEWFQDGNRQLNVVCHTGGEFYDSEIRRWKADGFVVVQERAGYGSPTVLEKRYRDPSGEEITVRLRMLTGSSGTFEDMDDADTHIVAYSGHASWGRTMATELARAPDEVPPTKLVLIHQCCGQGTINRFRDKYAAAHLVTTRHSSTEPEDFLSFKTVLEGIAARRSWTDIHDELQGARGNWRQNYITPADELTRMKTRDQDHDGKVDLLDRLFDFDTFDVEGDTQTAFSPKEPSRRDAVLSGERIHLASQIVNTSLGFSHYLEHLEKQAQFVGGGHFDPKPGDADYDKMVRLVERTVDTRDLNVSAARANLREGAHTLVEVQLNRRFAHASEEVVKAVTFFEVGMKYADGDTPLARALEGLMLAAHSLAVDDGYGRDKLIFDGLREHYGLPAELSYEDARRYLNADSHVYAGSREGLRRYREALSTDVRDRVERALVDA